MAQKKIMILGSLSEFTRLAEMAKARNCYTIVCDGYPNGPAKAIADASANIDVHDIEALARFAKEQKVDSIITSFSDLLFESMVKTAALTALPCYVTPQQLPPYRDKAVMKLLLASLGIQTPRYVLLKEDFSTQDLENLRFPVVTKPVDMYGSRGIFVLNSAEEAEHYFLSACASSDRKEILVEEYHSGYEFNLMSWVHKGTVHILGIADREKSAAGTNSIPISSRNVYPSCMIHDVYEPAKQILEKFIKATGQTEGALSMQFFWRPGEEPVVCEIAGRFLGYEHELIETSSGICLEELLLNYALGDWEAIEQALSMHSPFSEKHSAVLYFQAPPGGVIADQQMAEAIAKYPSVSYHQVFYQEGDIIGNQPYVCRYYVNGDNRKSIDDITKKIFRDMSIRDREGKELLYQNQMTNYQNIPGH